MRKLPYLISMVILLGSCTEYTKVMKSRDVDYKFDYAKRAYDQKKYVQASTILTDIYTPLRGTSKGEEALFLLAMSYYQNQDYTNSNLFFKTYYSRYPKGKFAELSRFYSGYGFYLDSPDPQLDQSYTVKAIEELSNFLELYPKSEKASEAQNAVFELQDKLTLKELQNAQLYYNLGNFMGNNYESAIIVAQNALKDYPYSKYREDFELLILKSKYQQAKHSVAEKMADRYRDVVDEYYSFRTNFPESKHMNEAETIFRLSEKKAAK
ncbi:MAG: outer membrane protein assembly factor BamD [Candidatus Amulumruptor caecigallinarius]|nr:outer membrane protein assembly factor BamD [Candidatus Amulumruptor caecigallinarius]